MIKKLRELAESTDDHESYQLGRGVAALVFGEWGKNAGLVP